MSFHRRDDREVPVFAGRAPHFFKIIFADGSLRHEKLRIPRRFIRKYGECLSNPAFLKLPSGAKWEIQLTKSNDGEVWLQNGWQDFAKCYSLDHGHLLLFRYEGNSHFKVLIFDKSATEIDYPGTSGEEGKLDEEFQIPEIEVIEISDDFQAPRPSRVREKSPLQCPRPHKKMRTNNPSGKTTASISNLQTSIPQTVTAIEKARALERASTFNSENPFCKVVMQQSYIHGSSNLNIPYNFAKKHISEEYCDLILRTSVGRTWPITYRVRKVINGNMRAELCRGWKAFARDNNLEVGDVCIFELFKGVEISMNVVIFRVAEDGNCHQSSGSGKLKQVTREENTIGEQVTQLPSSLRALEAASKFISENPFCQKTIPSACLIHGCLSIPRSFAKKCIEGSRKEVRLEVGDKWWPVTMLNSQTASSTLSAGWPTFAKENTLHQGDVCIFELIYKKRDDVGVKVSIFKRTPIG